MTVLIDVEIVDLDRRAVERSAEIVAGLRRDQLDGPTPCASWTLADLLSHLIVQHHGFAAAAAGAITERADWTPQRLGPDPVAEYGAAAERVIAAFASRGAAGGPFWLPEIRGGGPFPAVQAIGFHLVDYVVHGWDVAASLGVDAGYAPDLVEAALVLARQVPDGAAREVPGAAFGPALPDAGPAMDRLLRYLGRNPTWPLRPAN
jgi:uncharacterized protein (TIGR03086 family)